MTKNAYQIQHDVDFEEDYFVLLSTRNLKLAMIGTPRLEAKYISGLQASAS